MFAVGAHALAALAACGAGLVGGEFVCGALFVGGATALAGDFTLFLTVHRREAAAPRSGCTGLHIRTPFSDNSPPGQLPGRAWPALFSESFNRRDLPGPTAARRSNPSTTEAIGENSRE